MMMVAGSEKAKRAYTLVKKLQKDFVAALEANSLHSDPLIFQEFSWLRDQGKHGGGSRYMAMDENYHHRFFNRASVNISQVHYDDITTKKLASATAFSTIIHPFNPCVPSVHMHFSFTELKSGKSYWRLMADLNPSQAGEIELANQYQTALKAAAGEYYEEGLEQGDAYFTIPALKRTRGVAHFYLEGLSFDDFEKEYNFTDAFASHMIATYTHIFATCLKRTLPTVEHKEQQLAYHTLYFLQVMTLDRGTTSGLLVHDQNDLGILASIPQYIDRELLESWLPQMHVLQAELLAAYLNVLPQGRKVLVDDSVKLKLCKICRDFYKKNPEALVLQARGRILPPTVANHV